MTEVFTSHLDWTGARRGPTIDPSFSRDLSVSLDVTTLPMSAPAGFRGDPSRLNPEQLYVAAVSSCFALTFLTLAAHSRIKVVGFTDDAEGRLERDEGGIRMDRVVLRPHVVVAGDVDEALIRSLVRDAEEQCYIGRSVAARLVVEPTFERARLPADAGP